LIPNTKQKTPTTKSRKAGMNSAFYEFISRHSSILPPPMQIQSPAKINLFLAVTGRRPDGYHNLLSLMCPVDLHDELTLEFGVSSIELECNDPFLAQHENNLAVRAAKVFFDCLDRTAAVRIVLHKRIPVGAGLGGGSSNAASVLLGLNHHFGIPFSQTQLMGMGASLGADVPFFVFQAPAVATGIGQRLVRYQWLEAQPVLLVYPGFHVSTAEVFRSLNLRLTKCKKKPTRNVLKNGCFDVRRHLCNDLESVTAVNYPVIAALKQFLLDQGALGALMSGSGPTVFGIFSETEQAEKAGDLLAGHPQWRVFLSRLQTAAQS
jgi:4-diphosphocytidyl-2-C-methyl-D-erythritol kinase